MSLLYISSWSDLVPPYTRDSPDIIFFHPPPSYFGFATMKFGAGVDSLFSCTLAHTVVRPAVPHGLMIVYKR